MRRAKQSKDQKQQRQRRGKTLQAYSGTRSTKILYSESNIQGILGLVISVAPNFRSSFTNVIHFLFQVQQSIFVKDQKQQSKCKSQRNLNFRRWLCPKELAFWTQGFLGLFISGGVKFPLIFYKHDRMFFFSFTILVKGQKQQGLRRD